MKTHPFNLALSRSTAKAGRLRHMHTCTPPGAWAGHWLPPPSTAHLHSDIVVVPTPTNITGQRITQRVSRMVQRRSGRRQPLPAGTPRCVCPQVRVGSLDTAEGTVVGMDVCVCVCSTRAWSHPRGTSGAPIQSPPWLQNPPFHLFLCSRCVLPAPHDFVACRENKMFYSQKNVTHHCLSDPDTGKWSDLNFSSREEKLRKSTVFQGAKFAIYFFRGKQHIKWVEVFSAVALWIVPNSKQPFSFCLVTTFPFF